MIVYFIKSGICLLLLLVFYHLFLEREKMHQFNRFYLLGSILFSFLAPLFIIYVDAIPFVFENSMNIPISESTSLENEIIVTETINYTTYFIGFYLLISSILLIRFGKNLIHIFQKIRNHKNINYKNATIVLVDDTILPHTFLKYIFINQKDYQSKKIEKELFTHELTHVTQKHTIDVLLIEFLQIIFWINPIFMFLKKAVQLNHEYLADTKVIASHNNISKYQNVLLNKAAWNNKFYLASNLNYSLTKKRLLMMTTQSSQRNILLKKLAILPLLAIFIFLFAERMEAQEKEQIIEVVEENNSVFSNTEKGDVTIGESFEKDETQASFSENVKIMPQQQKATPKQLAEYNKLAKAMNAQLRKKNVLFKKKDVERINYLYNLMTTKQKKNAEPYPKLVPTPPPPRKVVKGGKLAPPPRKVVKGGKLAPPPRKVVKGGKLAPPPPPPANATLKQLQKYNKAKVEYNHKKGKRILPPPPIPKNATPKQKLKHAKAIENYKKAVNKNEVIEVPVKDEVIEVVEVEEVPVKDEVIEVVEVEEVPVKDEVIEVVEVEEVPLKDEVIEVVEVEEVPVKDEVIEVVEVEEISIEELAYYNTLVEKINKRISKNKPLKQKDVLFIKRFYSKLPINQRKFAMDLPNFPKSSTSINSQIIEFRINKTGDYFINNKQIAKNKLEKNLDKLTGNLSKNEIKNSVIAKLSIDDGAAYKKYLDLKKVLRKYGILKISVSD